MRRPTVPFTLSSLTFVSQYSISNLNRIYLLNLIPYPTSYQLTSVSTRQLPHTLVLHDDLTVALLYG